MDMTSENSNNRFGKGLAPGSHHYRAFIGPPEIYDICSAMQFNLITFLGLRQDDLLLDIGCGSLCAGKLFIPYLLPGCYFCMEPEQWLIDEGIKNELGKDIINIKAPVFSNDSDFTCSLFNKKFDYILAHSIFSHTSQAQIKRCLSQVKECMKPSSIFAATFWMGKDDYTGDKWEYSTCVTYTLERIVQLCLEHGLICEPIDWPHPTQKWVLIARPENVEHVRDLVDSCNTDTLRKQLSFYKTRLYKLEDHPYVKFGLRIKRGVRRILRMMQGIKFLMN